MSTNAHIGIYRGKNKVEFIYLHWDGYPSYALEMLKEHYKDREKVEKLIALGDISCLEEEVDIPNGVEHSFEKPHEGITIAYHRDRGESGCESRTTTLKQFAKDIEYAYLYKDGKWEEYEEPRKEC